MANESERGKQQAHELLDRLEPTQLSAVVGLLEVMVDPVSRAIARAGTEEEKLSPEGKKALTEAREWSKRNEGLEHEQILTELGISSEQARGVKS